MPHLLGAGQWPVPGASLPEAQGRVQIVSEGLFGELSLFWPGSSCGQAAVMSWNSFSSANMSLDSLLHVL